MFDTEDVIEPEFVVECITYGMVEGGYMPMAPSETNVDEAIAGTVRMLEEMVDRKDGDDPPWLIDIYRAMQSDTRLIKALIYRVFMHGWSHGPRVIPGVVLLSLRDLIPERVEARVARYFRIFRGNEPDGGTFYRSDLDAIPSSTDSWRVYHVPTECIVEDDLPDEESAFRRIGEFPERGEEVTR